MRIRSSFFCLAGLVLLITPAAGGERIMAEPKTLEVSEWTRNVIFEYEDQGIADIYVGDVDGDTQEEFVIVDVLPQHSVSLYDFEDGNWNRTYLLPRGTEILPADIELVDVDGDKDLDVLLGEMCSVGKIGLTNKDCQESYLVWFENIDNASRWERQIIGKMDVMGAQYVRAGDMDGDGDLDMLTGTLWFPVYPDTGEIVWFKNNLNEGKDWEKIVISPAKKGNVAKINMIDVADIDRDGHLDIAVTIGSGTEKEGSLYWYKSPGDDSGNWQQFQIHPDNELAAFTVFAIDINEDGYDDLALGHNNARAGGESGGIIFYLNPGNPEEGGTWQQYQLAEDEFKIGPYFNFVDIDSDEKLEIVSTYTGEDSPVALAGDPGNVSIIEFGWEEGKGLIQESREMVDPDQIKAWDIHAIDVNGDGEKGLIVSNFSGGLYFYERPTLTE